jgi:integrase
MVKGNRFTDKFIMSLKPEAKEYWIREGQGFALRVLPSGEKAWYYIYMFEGRKRFMKLKDGGYPDVSLSDAREAFDIAKVKVKNGIDPLTEKQQAKEERIKAPTIADLIDEYIDKHAKPNKRGWAEDKRILERDALKAWGKRKAADITKRDVVLLLEEIIKRGSPGSANNNFKIIRKMFRFAVQRDILQHTPCEGVVMPSPINSRDRVLSAEEIRTLWQTINSSVMSDEIRRVLKLILLTGQRPGEVVGMHTDEIDGRWWTIPVERSKNKKAHRVYLTDTALELIGQLEVADALTGELKPKGCIFPSPRTKKAADGTILPPEPIQVNAIAHAVRINLLGWVLVKGNYACGKDGQRITEGNRLGVDTFTPHDLRRTAATFMSQIGFMDEIIDAVLNHTKQGIIKTYNRNRYDDQKQQALEAWERKLNNIISAKESNVVPMIRKAA